MSLSNSTLDSSKRKTIRAETPLKKIVADVLDDEDNEWVTDIVPNESAEKQQQPSGAQGHGASSSQGAAATSQQKKEERCPAAR